MGKKKLAAIIVFLIFFFIWPTFSKTEAAFLKFDKASVSGVVGQTFQIGVIVDAGSEQITSSDAYVVYDATLLQALSVEAGSFFPTVTNNISAGRVYIAGLVDDPATSKTGSGLVATINFKVLKEGSGTLTFDCQQGANNTSKIIKNDLNATNIIVCSQNGQAVFSTGTGGQTTAPTPPQQLPQTGGWENVSKIAVPGIFLFLLGGVVRLFSLILEI